MAEFRCEQCGKPFHAKPSRGQRFCGRPCASLVNGPKRYVERETYSCRQCGKSFQRLASQDGGGLCSKRCRQTWVSRLYWGNKPDYAVDPVTKCWNWLKAKDRGYGTKATPKGKVGAHRVEWEKRHGPIPAGMHLHHTCTNRGCVNPDHMSLLTPAEHRYLHRMMKKSTQARDEVRSMVG